MNICLVKEITTIGMVNNMQEIQNIRTKDFVVKILIERILLNKILPDTKLSQEELASYFNISRIPIREALQILEKQGLVKRMSNRHVVVSALDNEEVRETFKFICEMVHQDILGLKIKDSSFVEFLEKWKNVENDKNDLVFHERIIFFTKNNFIKNMLKLSYDTYLENTCVLNNKDKKKKLLSKSIEFYLKNENENAHENLENYFDILADDLINERRSSK